MTDVSEEGLEEGTNLADLVAVERGLGVGGSGEKTVRKGGPLR